MAAVAAVEALRHQPQVSVVVQSLAVAAVGLADTTTRLQQLWLAQRVD